MGLNTGLTEAQLHQLLALEETSIGQKDAAAGRQVLTEVLAARQK
jgi:hypothetical protein